MILDLVEKYDTGWTYSEGVAQFSVEQQKKLGLVANDKASGVFGQFDPDRMASIVKDFTPFLVTAGSITQAAASAIDPSELYTNQFIDTSIKMN